MAMCPASNSHNFSIARHMSFDKGLSSGDFLKQTSQVKIQGGYDKKIGI